MLDSGSIGNTILGTWRNQNLLKPSRMATQTFIDGENIYLYVVREWHTARPPPRCFCIVSLMGYVLCRRPLTIVDCSKIADSWHFYEQMFRFLVRKLVLGGLATILEHWGAPERTL